MQQHDSHLILCHKIPTKSMRGVSLVEVLVALFLLAVGLLAIAQLQIRTLQETQKSFIESQAAIFAADAFDRIRANPEAMETVAENFDSANTPTSEENCHITKASFTTNKPDNRFGSNNNKNYDDDDDDDEDDGDCDDEDDYCYYDNDNNGNNGNNSNNATNPNANNCSPAQLAQYDLTVWGKNVNSLLPSGHATIDKANGSDTYTITIEWQMNANENEDISSLTLSAEIKT